MIRRIAILTIILLLTVFSVSGETKVMLITDPHYLSAELFDRDSLYFLGVISALDGRLTQYGPELMDALREEVRHQRPDALIITGDLSFDGGKKSHEELARRLEEIAKEGTEVYVIPGNHDINTIRPVGFDPESVYTVEDADEKEFTAIYRDLMREPEGGRGANLSYHVRVSDGLWIALADTACYQGIAYTNGIFTEDQASWLESVLKEAAEAGAKVVTASHHSLVSHSEFREKYYLMAGDDVMRDLKTAYDSPLHLSGHLHIQHIAEKDGIIDAATGAFCLYPHYYAMICLKDDGSLTYEAVPLCETHLPNGFMSLSRDWFTGTVTDKNRQSLEGTFLSPEEIESMLDFSARFHLGYFSGTIDGSEDWLSGEGYRLWEAQGGTFAEYVRTAVSEASGSSLSVRIE